MSLARELEKMLDFTHHYSSEENMAHIALDRIYTLKITVIELRLISKALGGRLDTDEDREEARNLGNHISALRIKDVEILYDDMMKLKKNILESNQL